MSSFHRWCLLIAVLVYFAAAWFGVGYHAEDEFQHVILFAEHLRGNADPTSLPIDYHAHWRSMAQPALCAGVFEVCEAIGITDPFQFTLILRLLTAALALWVMHGFIRSVSPLLKPNNQQAFIFLSYFLWFLPVLLIRYTGETWSGLLFLRGLCMLLDQRKRNAWIIGAWFSAAVLCRPAVALLPMGAMMWMLFAARYDRVRIVRVIAGGTLMLFVGVVIDRLCYQQFTFTLWNYAIAALGGVEAERFTALPWYQYLFFTLKYATIPIGVLLLIAFVILIALRPKHLLAWMLLPFLIVHSIMPIKELRFLFPLAPLMPWLLLAAWEALQDKWPKQLARTIWLRVLFPFAAVNLLALLIGVATPAGNGRIKLAQIARERFGQEPVHIDHLGNWRQWIPPFYLAPRSTEVFTDKVIADPKGKPIHLVMAHRSVGLDHVTNLERIAVATPAWADRCMAWYLLDDEHDPLVLYRITTQHSGH